MVLGNPVFYLPMRGDHRIDQYALMGECREGLCGPLIGIAGGNPPWGPRAQVCRGLTRWSGCNP